MAKKASKKAKEENLEKEDVLTEEKAEATQDGSAEETVDSEEKAEAEERTEEPEVEKSQEEILGEKLAEIQDKYIRLSAEFDNFRKRTLKEKMELIKSGGESVLSNILPVVDDFDRALGSAENSDDITALKEGMQLIKTKFNQFLEQNGVKEIEAKEKDFDTDLHEAVTKIPAPTEELKGKVVDVIEKGYYLNEKVLRFSKVVVGE